MGCGLGLLVDIIGTVVFWGSIVAIVHISLEHKLKIAKMEHELTLKNVELEIVKASKDSVEVVMETDGLVEDNDGGEYIDSEISEDKNKL